jgi:hypothetical protein
MKRLGPCANIEYLGLTIDSDELLVKIPQDKIEKLQDQFQLNQNPLDCTLKA